MYSYLWDITLVSLTHAIRDKSMVEPFKPLGNPTISSEHVKILNDIANVASAILSDKQTFRDPHISRPERDQGSKKEIEASSVKPDDLIKSLKDLHEQDKTSDSLGYGMNLSLTGVVRALFHEREEQYNIDDEVEAGEDDDNQDVEAEEGDEKESKGQKGKRVKKPTGEIPDEKYRKSLLKQMSTFFSKMMSKDFVSSCTATKLVQASAFPLAIALIGERGKWLSPEQARQLITKTVDVLFNINIMDIEGNGLIQIVGNRYREEGLYDVFLKVVGDGSLWVTLTASLANIEWADVGGTFEQGIVLMEVYDCRELRSEANIGKLNMLISKSQVAKAREMITLKAPDIVKSLHTIEDLLQKNSDMLLKTYSEKCKVGDILWNKKARWAIVKKVLQDDKVIAYLHLRSEEKKIVTKNYYINLRVAYHIFPEIKEYLTVFELGH